MKKKFICTVCGYVHEGDHAPEKCPICGAPASKFKEMDENAELKFVTEHEIGVAKGCDEQMIADLTAHFNGECGEVGMYLAIDAYEHEQSVTNGRVELAANGHRCLLYALYNDSHSLVLTPVQPMWLTSRSPPTISCQGRP